MRNWLVSLVAAPVVLAALFVAHAEPRPVPGRPTGGCAGLIPAKLDPTVDTIRWDQIAAELKRRGLCDDPNTFLFTDNWRFSAQLALATGYEAPVACFHRDARSFTFWSRPRRLGRPGRDLRPRRRRPGRGRNTTPPGSAGSSRSPRFPITRAGVPMQTVRLYRCVGPDVPVPVRVSPGRADARSRRTRPESGPDEQGPR